MNERYRDICERLGWYWLNCDDGNIELEKHSPPERTFLLPLARRVLLRASRSTRPTSTKTSTSKCGFPPGATGRAECRPPANW